MAQIPASVRDAEAQALRTLYEAQQPRPAHGVFGKAHGIGTAGMVWQCLSGHRPLNLGVATKFALALGVPIEQFSPRLAAAAALARGAGTNHMAVVIPAAPAAVREPAPQPRWPFPRIDEQRVRKLSAQQISDLEAAMLMGAAQLGLNIAKRRAA